MSIEPFLPFQYIDRFMGGMLLTLELTATGTFFGVLFGWVIAAARTARTTWLRKTATAYVEVWRNTPMLVQLFWVYYLLPRVLGTQLDPFVSITIALGLNAAAFFGEAFRGALQAFPRDERESADVLGLSYWQKMRYVIIPQVTLQMTPIILMLTIELFKQTSLVSTLGLNDVMYVGLNLATQTGRPIEMLTFTGLMYLVVGLPAAYLVTYVERRTRRLRYAT